MKKTTIKKPEAIKWHHFSRRGDAIFLSLKKEIRISVLSVATLAVACPDSSAAIMAMSQRPTMDEQTNSAAGTSSSGEDELLDLTALQHGDLLFCVASPARDGIAQAIVSVTEGIDLQRVSHVAIVCKESSGTYALEASDKHGVWLHPIQSFFEHCDHTPTGNPMVLLGRLKDTSNVAASVERAKTYLGRPYDHQYMPSDSAIYCSELIHYSYFDAEGKELFPQIPMSFHDKNGNITTFWKDYYRQWNMSVPEGWPGTNPGGISQSEKIEIIGKFF